MTPRRPVVLMLLLLLASLNLLPHSQSLQPDAVSLLSFKSKADLDNILLYAIHEPYDYCEWKGAKCGEGGRVVRLSLPSSRLRGTFPDNTLSGLRLLRVLNLRNNSLSGPIPDLSPLLFLKSLFLSHNSFSSSIPPSVASLRNLAFLDLSCNRFNGTVPPLNLTFLSFFNASDNELSGVVPVTPTLSRFGAASFLGNPGLCGEIVNKACKSGSPFFGSNSSSPLGQSAQADGGGNVVVVVSPPAGRDRRKRRLNAAVLAATVAVSLLAVALLVTFLTVLMKRPKCPPPPPREDDETGEETAKPKQVRVIQQDDHADERQVVPVTASKRGDRKSSRLVFCGGSGEGAAFGMEELMRASAELLGRGTVGTTYKAVMEGGRVVLTVKRLDASKTSATSAEAFERHMEAVGGAPPHPNLVPLLAYFQANGERLLVYRYHPNGSLFNLLHGSRSARAKPLHWTSCLKIAEDVAQGLSHIHQVCKLVHGNLKSSNVLLGDDFEACITDCSIAVLADISCAEDPDSAACRGPENRNFSRRATAKSDVYAFGVLVVELLTGKYPSQHPYLAPSDMLDWVRAMRDDDTADYEQLGMLTEVASICTLTSPEQRPAMWQVLKMIQEIKESVLAQDNAAPPYS